MKKSLKERQLEVLKTNTVKWNRYMRFCFSINFLFSVNLSWSNLKGSNLSWSNLEGSNLDMSCLSLSCKSLKFKSDLKIRTQIGFHFASLIANAEQENVTKEEKEIYAKMLDYVNRFHRIDVAKLAKLQ